MDKNKIIEDLEALGEQADAVGFKGNNEYELYLRLLTADYIVKLLAAPAVSVRYSKCPVCNDKIAIKKGDPHWRGEGVHFNDTKRCKGKYSVDISEEEYNAR